FYHSLVRSMTFPHLDSFCLPTRRSSDLPRPAPAVPAGPDHPYDPRRGGCEMTAVHPSSAPPEALARDLTGADAAPSGDGKEKGAGRKRKDRGRLSVEWVTLELMRVAYASRGGFLSRRDPRAVIIWYVICAIAP